MQFEEPDQGALCPSVITNELAVMTNESECGPHTEHWHLVLCLSLNTVKVMIDLFGRTDLPTVLGVSF